jgi:hypothetical protein
MHYWRVSVSVYYTLLMLPGRRLAQWIVECSSEPQQSDFLAACQFFQVKVHYPNAMAFQKDKVDKIRSKEAPAFEHEGCRFWVLWQPGQTERLPLSNRSRARRDSYHRRNLLAGNGLRGSARLV